MGSNDTQRALSPTRAATRVQAAYRSYLQRREFKKQQRAAHIIQSVARSWLQRKRAAQLLQEEASTARFKAVMQRHMQRIQQLEAEKHQLQQLPLRQLDSWQQKRHAAAARIQAHWRGRVQRKTIQQLHPDLTISLTRCDSPDVPADAAPDQKAAAAGSALTASVTALPAPLGAADSMYTVSTSLTASSSQWRLLGAAGGAAAAAGGPLVVPQQRVISDVRRTQLLKQVQHRVDAKRAAASVQPVKAAASLDTNPKLQQLLTQHTSTEQQRVQAEAQRQHLLRKTELLCAQLEQLPPLSSMPSSAQPSHFPMPPRDDGRLDAARQAHALALAEAKVSSRWWLPLKQLCEADSQLAQQGKGGAWPEHWSAQEAVWQQVWARVRREQQQVEDVVPLTVS